MELKKWTYEEYPEFADDRFDAIVTDGNETGALYLNDVEYVIMDGTPLYLQILIPHSRNQTEGKYPCFVYVQGSGWKKQHVHAGVPLLSRMADCGYVCAIVEYRHSGIAAFPAPVIDARNAVRFLRSHADEYQIDPDRMILAGSSSGGHTAVYGGLRHNDDTDENMFPGVSAEVSGIINYYGSCSFMFDYSNPSTPNHLKADSPEGLEAGGIDLSENEKMKRAMSAECNIHEDTRIAPMLIFHGTKDRTVHPECSVRLHDQMIRTGHECELVLLKGADHGGPDFWGEEVLARADAFMQKCFKK